VQEELDAVQSVERLLPHQGVDLAGGGRPGGATKDGGTASDYNQFGLLRWTRDINGNVTNFDYAPRGNLTGIRDDDGHVLLTSTYNTC